MSIKVMLADDHVLMREGIRQLLELTVQFLWLPKLIMV